MCPSNYSFLFGDDVRYTSHQCPGPSTVTSCTQSSGPQSAGPTTATAGADLERARSTLHEYKNEPSEQADSRFNVSDSLRHEFNADDVRDSNVVGSDFNVGEAAPCNGGVIPCKVSSLSDYKRRTYREVRDRALSPALSLSRFKDSLFNPNAPGSLKRRLASLKDRNIPVSERRTAPPDGFNQPAVT